MDTTVVKFNASDATLNAIQKYKTLSITDIDDAKAVSAVTEAWREVRDIRLDIEATRKSLKQKALEYGRRVDAEAKRLRAIVDPVEQHLNKNRQFVQQEKERRMAEAQRQAQERLQSRIDRLRDVDAPIDVTALQSMADDEFLLLLAEESETHNRVQLLLAADAHTPFTETRVEVAELPQADFDQLVAHRHEQRQRRERSQATVTALARFGVEVEWQSIAHLPQDEHDRLIVRARDEHKTRQKLAAEEKQRLAEEAAAAQAERDAMEKTIKQQQDQIAKLQATAGPTPEPPIAEAPEIQPEALRTEPLPTSEDHAFRIRDLAKRIGAIYVGNLPDELQREVCVILNTAKQDLFDLAATLKQSRRPLDAQ